MKADVYQFHNYGIIIAAVKRESKFSVYILQPTYLVHGGRISNQAVGCDKDEA